MSFLTHNREPLATGCIVLGTKAASGSASSALRRYPIRARAGASGGKHSTWVSVDPTRGPIALSGQMEAARTAVLLPALAREIAGKERSVVSLVSMDSPLREAFLTAASRRSTMAFALDAQAPQVLGIEAIEPVWGATLKQISIIAHQIAWNAGNVSAEILPLSRAIRDLLIAAQGLERHQASLPALATLFQTEGAVERLLARLSESASPSWPKPPSWWITYSLPASSRPDENTSGLSAIERMGPEIFEHILSERERGQSWPTETATLRDVADTTLEAARLAARRFIANSTHIRVQVRSALAPFATTHGWRMFARAAVNLNRLGSTRSPVVVLIAPGTDPRLSTLAAVATVNALVANSNEEVLLLAENGDNFSPVFGYDIENSRKTLVVAGVSGRNPIRKIAATSVLVREVDGRIRLDTPVGQLDATPLASQALARETLALTSVDASPAVPPKPTPRMVATRVTNDPIATRMNDRYAQTVRDLTGVGLNDPIERPTYV